MQGLLKDHLVEICEYDQVRFSLTCSVCGAAWKSVPVPGNGREVRFSARMAAAEEARKHSCMCSFCGRPVCLTCYVDVGGISLCEQCARRLRERVDAE